MNCTRCNAPLEPEARFCRVCGQAVLTGIPQPPVENAKQTNRPNMGDSPTVPTPFLQPQQPTQVAPLQPQYTPPQSIPPQAYQPTVAVSPGSLPSAGSQLSSPPFPKRRRKNLLARVLLILVVVLLVLVAGWFIGLRPLLHGIAQNQIDQVLTNAVNQINPVEIALLPPGRASIALTETDLNEQIAQSTSSSDPVQQMHMTVTPGGVRLDFQTYGLASTITGVPQVINGQLVIKNVAVQGIASLLISPDELTTTLNAHLSDAGARLHRSVNGITLKDHEMVIQFR